MTTTKRWKKSWPIAPWMGRPRTGAKTASGRVCTRRSLISSPGSETDTPSATASSIVPPGRFEAVHRRSTARNQKSVLPEHRAARLAAVAGKRGRRYLKRQDLFDIGPAAVDYLSEIVHRRPRSWSGDVDELHDLLQTHGPVALHHAIEGALAAQTYGAEYVAHFLQQSLFEPMETRS